MSFSTADGALEAAPAVIVLPEMQRFCLELVADFHIMHVFYALHDAIARGIVIFLDEVTIYLMHVIIVNFYLKHVLTITIYWKYVIIVGHVHT